MYARSSLPNGPSAPDCSSVVHPTMVLPTDPIVPQADPKRPPGSVQCVRPFALLSSLTGMEFLQRVLADRLGIIEVCRHSSGHKGLFPQVHQSCWVAFQRYVAASNLSDIREDTIFQYLSYLFYVKRLARGKVASHLLALADPIRYGFGISLDTCAISLIRHRFLLHRPRLCPDWSF